MPYLAGSAQAQLGALPLGFVGWSLLGVALGLVEWRVWLWSRSALGSSSVAWIGVWRACFHSHQEVTPVFLIMHCSPISLWDAFIPWDIAVAQVLMLLALGLGLCGITCGMYALRNAFFGVRPLTRLMFHVAGALTFAAAILALIPLVWSLVAVLTNGTIAFPPEFKLPESPEAQQVGGAVWTGLVGVALLVVTAIIFISYKLPKEGTRHLRSREGKDNPAFEFEDIRL